MDFEDKVSTLECFLKDENNSVVIPTDTVLGILSINENNIISIKKRDSSKKTIVFIDSVDRLAEFIPPILVKLVKKFWPGNLTIIYKGKAYRMPNHPVILKALSKINKPIYASSANLTNNQIPKCIEDAKKEFEYSDKKIIYLDYRAGKKDNLVNSIPSTIFNYDTKQIIREGEVSEEQIFSILEKNS